MSSSKSLETSVDWGDAVHNSGEMDGVRPSVLVIAGIGDYYLARRLCVGILSTMNQQHLERRG
jgi:hypothetical protein